MSVTKSFNVPEGDLLVLDIAEGASLTVSNGDIGPLAAEDLHLYTDLYAEGPYEVDGATICIIVGASGDVSIESSSNFSGTLESEYVGPNSDIKSTFTSEANLLKIDAAVDLMNKYESIRKELIAGTLDVDAANADLITLYNRI